MKTLITITFLLSGCVSSQPQDCWRTGVAMDNTGPMSSTPINEIPVVSLNLEGLYAACDLPPPPPLAWSNRGYKETEACYQQRDDTIYILNTSRYSYVLQHEICHILKGEKHNSCYGKGYAQWGADIQSACDWDKEI